MVLFLIRFIIENIVTFLFPSGDLEEIPQDLSCNRENADFSQSRSKPLLLTPKDSSEQMDISTSRPQVIMSPKKTSNDTSNLEQVCYFYEAILIQFQISMFVLFVNI